jgi:hypothetical protein
MRKACRNDGGRSGRHLLFVVTLGHGGLREGRCGWFLVQAADRRNPLLDPFNFVLSFIARSARGKILGAIPSIASLEWLRACLS